MATSDYFECTGCSNATGDYYQANWGETFSKLGDKIIGGLSSEQGQALTATALSQIGKGGKATLKKEIKVVCGRKPLFGKAKKEAWQKCASEYANKDVTKAQTELATAQAQENEAAKSSRKTLYITLGVIGGLVIIGGAWLALRK